MTTTPDDDVPPPEQLIFESDQDDTSASSNILDEIFDEEEKSPFSRAAVTPLAQEESVVVATPSDAPVKQFAVWDPSQDQVHASAGILDWWSRVSKKRHLHDDDILTIGGYAGSGKTALVGHTAMELIKNNHSPSGGANAPMRVAFATYTGKASQVLDASLTRAGVLSDYTGTIHRLMYRPNVDERTGRVKGWIKQEVMPYDLIVIDEASMVPTKLVEDLQSYGVPILAVGDHGQLAPVGEDAGLMADPHFRLETIHRQAKGNPIIELSMMIRQGVPLKKLLNFMNEDPTGKLCWLAGHEGTFEALEFAAPPGLIVCFTNKKRVTTNTLMRKTLQRTGGPVPTDVVICVKNAYLPSGMLANGARGTVVSCEEKGDDHYLMTLDTGDGRGDISFTASKHQFGRSATFKEFSDIPSETDFYNWDDVGVLLDFGYALTCHKSQGSQAQSVAVLIERSLSYVLSDDEYKRWLYTSATRSADRLMFVTDV